LGTKQDPCNQREGKKKRKKKRYLEETNNLKENKRVVATCEWFWGLAHRPEE
jgi:hypothetical protein